MADLDAPEAESAQPLTLLHRETDLARTDTVGECWRERMTRPAQSIARRLKHNQQQRCNIAKTSCRPTDMISHSTDSR